jgi:hypothetical protein
MTVKIAKGDADTATIALTWPAGVTLLFRVRHFSTMTKALKHDERAKA